MTTQPYRITIIAPKLRCHWSLILRVCIHYYTDQFWLLNSHLCHSVSMACWIRLSADCACTLSSIHISSSNQMQKLTSQRRCCIVSFSSEVAFTRKIEEGWLFDASALIGGSLFILDGDMTDLAIALTPFGWEWEWTDFVTWTPESIAAAVCTVALEM